MIIRIDQRSEEPLYLQIRSQIIMALSLIHICFAPFSALWEMRLRRRLGYT